MAAMGSSHGSPLSLRQGFGPALWFEDEGNTRRCGQPQRTAQHHNLLFSLKSNHKHLLTSYNVLIGMLLFPTIQSSNHPIIIPRPALVPVCSSNAANLRHCRGFLRWWRCHDLIATISPCSPSFRCDVRMALGDLPTKGKKRTIREYILNIFRCHKKKQCYTINQYH